MGIIKEYRFTYSQPGYHYLMIDTIRASNEKNAISAFEYIHPLCKWWYKEEIN